MTLDELLNKFEGVLLAAPMLRAELIDMVQDERADERKACEQLAYAAGATLVAFDIRQRNIKES